jgi:antitoxin component of MazEF toxin-antitoxin module
LPTRSVWPPERASNAPSRNGPSVNAIGNSLGIVIEKPILELLDIDRETELEMTTDGQRLIIEPVRQRRKRVLASAKKVMDAHDETFRKLAK